MNHTLNQAEIELYQAQVMGGWAGPAAAAQPTEQQSLWSLVDDRLRGRWLWMLLVGGVLGVVIGIFGFRSTAPLYLSEGAIRVAPRLPATLGPIPETDVMEYFDRFVATQAEYLRSRRVLETALRDETLSALSFAKSPNALIALEKGLLIETDQNSELIFVSFESDDAEIARAACAGVMAAYDQIHGRELGADASQTLLRLYDLEAQFQRDLKSARQDVQLILARHHTTNLNELHAQRAARQEAVEQQLAAANAALENGGGSVEADGRPRVSMPIAAELEKLSPRLAELRNIRDLALSEFDLAKRTYRPGSAQFARAEQRARQGEELYQEQYRRVLAEWETTGFTTIPQDGFATYYASMSASALREEVAALQTRLASLRQTSTQILSDIQLLNDREFEAERIQSDLDRTQERIRGLELEEKSIASRISIAQEATRPLAPDKDSRVKRAMGGVVFGFALSFGAFFLLGTVDRRTYGANQLDFSTGSQPRCLGVLPDLGRSMGDPETSDVASHCVHQIRNQIEVTRDPSAGYVIAVSSPFQGDGKTSIVMALGWSYAAAGYQTLLVDCDLVGRSLTRQLGMIGRTGLKEAIASGHLNGAVTNLPVAHLSALPVGVHASVGPESIRRSDLKRIFDAVRGQYEIVIVDTGPMLGSLESTPVTASADGVILSLRRGRSRTRLDDCVQRLRAVGAKCIGIVLNAVDRSECARYVSEASLAAAEVERRAHGEGDSSTVVHAAGSERNVLMLAMECSSRQRDGADSSA